MKLSFFSVLLLAGHLCVAAPMPLPESNDGARHVFSTNQENFFGTESPSKSFPGKCIILACRANTGRTRSSA